MDVRGVMFASGMCCGCKEVGVSKVMLSYPGAPGPGQGQSADSGATKLRSSAVSSQGQGALLAAAVH
jgi:hypothetical protein